MRAAAVFLGATLLGACQSNPEPPPLETVTEAASPSPTAGPSPVAPTMPAKAQGRSEAAAKAFVRHYFASLNHAMNSGETQHLRSLAEPGCESCDAIAGNIEKTYADGGRIESEGWEVRSVAAVPGQPAHKPILDLGILMQPEAVIRSEGAEPQEFDGGKQPMTIYLTRNRSGWLVARLDRVA